MDELFTKEKTLCDVSSKEGFPSVFLQSLEKIQSRKICSAFLSRVEEDGLEISEVFLFMQEAVQIAKRINSYSLERIKKKFDGLRLIKYVLSRPVQLGHKEETGLCEFIDVFEIVCDEKHKIPLSNEAVQTRVLFYLAKKSKITELEVEAASQLVKIVKARRNQGKQEYLEEIVDLLRREIKNKEFAETVKEEIKTNWPYEKTNPAQKVLLALLEQEPCPYENFKSRKIDIHTVSPFFIRDKETIHLMPVIFCIERILEQESETVTAEISRPDPASKTNAKFVQCTAAECSQQINTEHFRFYLMHKLRIDAEVERLTNETLMCHLNDTSLIGKGAMHLKKYQSDKYLMYVVNTIKKIGKKKQKSKPETEAMQALLSSLKYFPMHGPNEDYILSISKTACQEVSVVKIVLVLNILYAVRGTKKIGFAIALVTHELLKKTKQNESELYIGNIVYATGKKQAKCLEVAKPLILDHLLHRSSDDITVILNTLSKLYRYPTAKAFIEREKYLLAPRLWQNGLIDEYYAHTPSISIYYAMYIYEIKKNVLQEENTIKEQIKRTICETGPESVATIYIALPKPEELFAVCGIDTKELVQRFSLMSMLFTTRRILEDKIVPAGNCIFNLICLVVQAFYTEREPSTNELQEVVLFLVHTGNIKSQMQCCSMQCAKERFFDDLIRKSCSHDLIHYKYMFAHELTKKQKETIEKVAGKDVSLYLEDASTLEECVVRIHPYLKLRSFFAFLSIKKILPTVLRSEHRDAIELKKTHWPQCKLLIVSLCRMYIDSRDSDALKSLAYFGLQVLDALEEGHDKTDLFLEKSIGLIDMEHKTKTEIVSFFISNILIPIYYETLDDLLLYIIQELIKDTPLHKNLPEHTEFITRLQSSKYVIEIDASRLSEIKMKCNKSAYRRGISHINFLIGLITVLAESPRRASIFPVLENTLAILDTLEGKKWPQRHKVSLLQFYLFLMIYSLKPLNTEEIREQFVPVFKDVQGGALIDPDILRTAISNSLCMTGVFTSTELFMCSKYVQDTQFTIRLLEEQLRACKNLNDRDHILTKIQEEHLQIKEKDAVFGINAVIQKLSPVNLAAELKINNEHANYTYLRKDILGQLPQPEKKDSKYKELFESLNSSTENSGQNNQDSAVDKILRKAEEAIQQWTHTMPLHTFSRDPDSLKTFLIDAHILQDFQILQGNKPLPKALNIIRSRRESARSYESLRVSEIHRQLLMLFPHSEEVEAAEKDALLHGVRIARKSGQCELSEKLLIRSILKDDWRVFYEKAKIHLLKSNKSLAKQALQRLMLHLPKESEYKQKAILLNTEIEKSEDIYKSALASLKTNEQLYFNYGKYLEKKQPVLAFKMFCKVLEYGHEKAPEIVPKLIHYITDTSNAHFLKENVGDCAAEMQKTLQKVDIKIFRRCYMQILTRLSHKDKVVEDLLSTISLRLIEKFPAEFSWRTLALFKNKKNAAIHSLIERTSFSFRKLFSDVIEFTGIVSRISMYTAGSGVIHIPTILGSSLSVTKGIPAPCDDFTSAIISVSDVVFVFPTLQKPKKIQTLTSSGCYKSFLCKANDDLRKDAVFMDLNMLLNSLFQSDNECKLFSIRVYTVVPITEKIGILEFVENLHTLKSICDELYREKGIDLKSIGVSMGFNKKIETLGRTLLKELLEKVPPVFSLYFLRQFTRPIDWLQARKRYTITYAVMNAVGYLMGLGDRHCENILFDGKTGETVHVDLNCIFDKGLSLRVPETVPFRLTQNIVDAFGPTKEEGQYKLTLERVLKFLSLNKDLIVANLLGFVHDPLGEWTGRNNAKMAIQVIEKIKVKIDFDDEITKSCLLIEKSMSLEALEQMYVWWLPFI
ncbi:serine/threonine-protein kinase ATR [Nematocida minor]|uniref:serine/threonine-protein kinase ATR n=1 Tax=Nematocida minor TaxID=1912983 RepID=UPI00221F45C3|nr:serine/threonine-protein kinase ATR [Nematocida minor]KAI5191427.1 serine/threonine-protein kinase ATR [Nematocida minor]